MCQDEKITKASGHPVEDSQPKPCSQGCQIFLGATYQNMKNIPNDRNLNKPNSHKIYQMKVK
jgi:hypothetical protein